MRAIVDESTMTARIQESMYCDHCGNQTYRRTIGTSFALQDDSRTFLTYTLYECEICRGVILEREESQLPENYFGSKQLHNMLQEAKTICIEQLWPLPLSLPPGAPLRVREIYQEARAVMRRSASSFVVQIGRALEAVTKDKDAKGDNLNNRLNWLIKEGDLPPVFGEMAHINRIFRNWGAHDAETDIRPEDAEIADEFFKAIIEYLYVAPAKVEKVKSLISQR